LAFRFKTFKPFEVLPIRSEAALQSADEMEVHPPTPEDSQYLQIRLYPTQYCPWNPLFLSDFDEMERGPGGGGNRVEHVHQDRVEDRQANRLLQRLGFEV